MPNNIISKYVEEETQCVTKTHIIIYIFFFDKKNHIPEPYPLC